MGYIVNVEEDGESRYEPRNILTIDRNGKIVGEHTDGGEPEDQSFHRNWSWVQGALMQAYRYGVEDGREERATACG